MLLRYIGAELSKALTHKTTEYRDSTLAKSKPCPTLIHRCLLPITNCSRHRENGFPSVLSVYAFSCTGPNLAALQDKVLFNIKLKCTVCLKVKGPI